MKKLFIACLIFMTSVAVAELAYDQQTGKFYSKNAPKSVNKEEYNELWYRFIQIHSPRGILDLTAPELAAVFVQLRSHGTAAALRFIHDAEKIVKTARKDLKRINNL